MTKARDFPCISTRRLEDNDHNVRYIVIGALAVLWCQNGQTHLPVGWLGATSRHFTQLMSAGAYCASYVLSLASPPVR